MQSTSRCHAPSAACDAGPASASTPRTAPPPPPGAPPRGPKEPQPVSGLPVTRPERSIVDALESGAQPEQIELAIGQALERELTTPSRLRRSAAPRSGRVRQFVERCLDEIAA